MTKELGLLVSLIGSTYLYNIKAPNEKILPLLGMGLYSILLFGAYKKAEWTNAGIKLSAIVHSGLILKMLKEKKLCTGCLAVAAGNTYSLLTV